MEKSELRELMKLFFKPHPWHGVSPGTEAPAIVRAFIEQVPTDTVKYEVDKPTGYLKVDRPHKFSSLCPSLYGFIPRTYCGKRVGDYCSQRTGVDGIEGDGDPIDICVLSERPISHGNFLLTAVPVGGIRMVDSSQADDKIIAVMPGDAVYGEITEITGLPEGLVERLVHYFLSYKDLPSPVKARKVEVQAVYGRVEALKVIQMSLDDYVDRFDDPVSRVQALMTQLAR